MYFLNQCAGHAQYYKLLTSIEINGLGIHFSQLPSVITLLRYYVLGYYVILNNIMRANIETSCFFVM